MIGRSTHEVLCPKCGLYWQPSGYARHTNACQGPRLRTQLVCFPQQGIVRPVKVNKQTCGTLRRLEREQGFLRCINRTQEAVLLPYVAEGC